MNINTFFLDKLLAGEQSTALSSKKAQSPTYLFSDIIKVFEQDGEQNSAAGDSAAKSNLSSQDILQLPVNIECNGAKLQAIGQYIDAFMADPQLSVKATEVKHDLQSVVINKKQFLLSSGSLENFINGLIQNLGLNNSDDLKTVLSQNTTDESATDILKNISVKADAADKLNSKKKTDAEVKTDDSPSVNGNNIAQSLLQYLSENKSLSLSIKNGKDKLNINFHALPEENIESELNLEKLSADFNKNSKELNAAFSSVLKEQEKEKTLTTAASRDLEKNPADFNSSSSDQNNIKAAEAQYENVSRAESLSTVDSAMIAKLNDSVYKTEVVEITFNPSVQSKNVNSTSSVSKIYQLPSINQTDLAKSSGAINFSQSPKEFELFDAGFRLRNNFAAQLNALQYAGQNGLTAESSSKTTASNTNPLTVQQSEPVIKIVESGSNKIINADIINSAQHAVKISSEKDNVVKEVKVLLDDLKGALESSEITKSTSQKDKINLSGQSLEMKKDASQIKTDLSSQNQETKNNVQSASISQKETENISTAILSSDEKTKTEKSSDHIKSVTDESVKSDKVEIKKANGSSSEGKDLSQNKSNDNFKNILQSSEQTKGVDTEKLKIMTEAKQINEPVKFIKPTEIIPEFSKIIQAGEKQSMTFQLTPENLGKVKLIVDLVGNQISTRIEVENEQVKQYVQSNIEQLKQNLQSAGVNLSNVNVSLGESEQKFAKTFTSRKKMGEKISKIKEGDDTTRRSQKSLGYNTYEYLA